MRGRGSTPAPVGYAIDTIPGLSVTPSTPIEPVDGVTDRLADAAAGISAAGRSGRNVGRKNRATTFRKFHHIGRQKTASIVKDHGNFFLIGRKERVWRAFLPRSFSAVGATGI
jgi:hypothetical protein